MLISVYLGADYSNSFQRDIAHEQTVAAYPGYDGDFVDTMFTAKAVDWLKQQTNDSNGRSLAPE